MSSDSHTSSTSTFPSTSTSSITTDVSMTDPIIEAVAPEAEAEAVAEIGSDEDEDESTMFVHIDEDENEEEEGDEDEDEDEDNTPEAQSEAEDAPAPAVPDPLEPLLQLQQAYMAENRQIVNAELNNWYHDWQEEILMWICPACTIINTRQQGTCQVCESAAPEIPASLIEEFEEAESQRREARIQERAKQVQLVAPSSDSVTSTPTSWTCPACDHMIPDVILSSPIQCSSCGDTQHAQVRTLTAASFTSDERKQLIPPSQVDSFRKHVVNNCPMLPDLCSVVVSYLTFTGFNIGDAVDCQDTAAKWLPATIQQVKDDAVYIHYNGWSDKWNEWIDVTSERIQPASTHATGSTRQGDAAPVPVNDAERAQKLSRLADLGFDEERARIAFEAIGWREDFGRVIDFILQHSH